MSSANDPRPNHTVKLLISGDSGTAKTGALTSLILAGYRVVIADLDNGIDILIHCLKSPDSPYYKAASKIDLDWACRYETINPNMIVTESNNRIRIQPEAATVWPKLQRMIRNWKETSGVELGPVASWKEDTVFVLDSSTLAGIAALAYVQGINNRLGTDPSGNAWRRDINGAQSHMENLLQLLYSNTIKCHVLIISHINYYSPFMQDQKDDKGNERRVEVISASADAIFSDSSKSKAFPTMIGRALGPKVGRYFNSVIETRKEIVGGRPKFRIYTRPQLDGVSVKSSAPFSLKEYYDVSTGLAEIFEVLTRNNIGEPLKPEPNQT